MYTFSEIECFSVQSRKGLYLAFTLSYLSGLTTLHVFVLYYTHTRACTYNADEFKKKYILNRLLNTRFYYGRL